MNRPLAPDIYRSALPIVRQGRPFCAWGDGEIVEWAVHMRRSDENATLDHGRRSGEKPDAIIDKLALFQSAPLACSRPNLDGSGAPRMRLQNLHRAEPRCFRRAALDLRPPTARKVTSICGCVRDRALNLLKRQGKPVSFAAVTAICTCAISFSSMASRRCLMRWNSRTRLQPGTFFTIWPFF